MKTSLLLAILFILASCSSSRIDRKIHDGSWDSLADESYMRWGEGRLEKHASLSLRVMGCYKGETKEALEAFKKEYLTKNQDPYYWLHIGNCYFIDEKWQKAEFYYRLSLEEAKTKTLKSVALNNLGLIHFKYEQWEKGKDFLKEAMNLAPKFKVPRYNISQLYLQFGLYDRAIDVLSSDAFRGHKDIDVYFSLANAHLYKGDMAKAGGFFKMIPEENFRREDIAATYALFLIKTGRLKEAKDIMDERSRSGVPELSEISQKIEKMITLRLKKE